MHSNYRNATGGLRGNGVSLEPPADAERDMGRIDAFIASQPYWWKRDKCEMFRNLNAARGYRRRQRFSAWLREDVENRLIAADHKANEDWY